MTTSGYGPPGVYGSPTQDTSAGSNTTPPPGASAASPSTGGTSPYTVPTSTTNTSTSSTKWDWNDGQWGMTAGGLGNDVIVFGGIPGTSSGTVTPSSYSTGQNRQFAEANGTQDPQVIDSQFNPLGHATALQAMNYFMGLYGADRSQFNGLREALANAGFYGSSDMGQIVNRAAGRWDTDAMHQALLDYTGWAQQTGSPMTFVEWLQGAEGNPNLAGNAAMGNYGGGTAVNGSRSGAGGGSVVMTDPAQLSMYAQRAARASLGRELSQDQLDTFVNEFHAAEANNQQSAMTGGAKVNSSDARSESIQYVENNFRPEMEQHQTQGYMNALLDMFLPSADQRANINTDPNAVSY